MDSFQHQLDRWRSEGHAPLVTAAIRRDGALVWLGASSAAEAGGSTSSAAQRRRFCIYSITKTFTAVCILRLAQAGMLDLETPIARWLDLPAGVPSVSMAHLLRHTGGLPDYGGVREYHDAVSDTPSVPWTERQFLEFAAAKGPLFAPGEGWAYSNIGYMLLRMAAERVTGTSYRQVVYDHIVSPLGLEDTFVAETLADWDTCVPGYGPECSTDARIADVRSTYHPGWCAPGVAGSTVEDVTMFYDALFAGRLLAPAPLAQMLELVRVPGEHPPFVTPSYGMGIMADPDSPLGALYGHGGGGPGYTLTATSVPRASAGRVSVAVFCNSSTGCDVAGCERALLRTLV